MEDVALMFHVGCDLALPSNFIVSCGYHETLSCKTLYIKNQTDFKENLKKETFLFLRTFSKLTLQSKENQIQGGDKVFGLAGC